MTHNCVVEKIPKNDIFIKIKNLDQYLFVVNKAINVTSMCPDNSKTLLQLNGTHFNN